MLKHLAIVGYGSIAKELILVLSRALDAPLERLTVLVRPDTASLHREELLSLSSKVARESFCVDNAESLFSVRPDLLIECAGHSAVSEFVPASLKLGIETIVTSIGALSDDDLHEALRVAALEGNTSLILPTGAIGGIDILAGIRHSGIESVHYTSCKPPIAWKGTPAEQLLDLDSLTSETEFYIGSARDAAADYPKNANVAATVALAGLGFDKTMVRMVADPNISANIHLLDVKSAAGNINIRIEGKPSPRNPKTSMPTVYSLNREVLNRIIPVVI